MSLGASYLNVRNGPLADKDKMGGEPTFAARAEISGLATKAVI